MQVRIGLIVALEDREVKAKCDVGLPSLPISLYAQLFLEGSIHRSCAYVYFTEVALFKVGTSGNANPNPTVRAANDATTIFATFRV